jgi:hypothetical protein
VDELVYKVVVVGRVERELILQRQNLRWNGKIGNSETLGTSHRSSTRQYKLCKAVPRLKDKKQLCTNLRRKNGNHADEAKKASCQVVSSIVQHFEPCACSYDNIDRVCKCSRRGPGFCFINLKFQKLTEPNRSDYRCSIADTCTNFEGLETNNRCGNRKLSTGSEQAVEVTAANF